MGHCFGGVREGGDRDSHDADIAGGQKQKRNERAQWIFSGMVVAVVPPNGSRPWWGATVGEVPVPQDGPRPWWGTTVGDVAAVPQNGSRPWWGTTVGEVAVFAWVFAVGVIPVDAWAISTGREALVVWGHRSC
jgi:hypothetical protein